ncbi:MAG: hypothetical protein WBV79_19430 [Rhodomicrobium sp.]
MITLEKTAFSGLARDIAAALVSARADARGLVIKTPLLYPSNSTVQVRVDSLDGRFFVSDMAQAFQEAEMMGAPRTFKHHAPAIAKNAGIGFDQQAFFVAEAQEGQLIGAVMAVANCSSEAATVVAHKIAEKKNDDYINRLYDRLFHVFGKTAVTKEVEVQGASATPWLIAARVEVGRQVSLFDYVSPHPNSIAAAVTKFGDIAQLVDAPERIAVAQNKPALGTRLTVLSRTANVIELGVSDQTIRELAMAA